MPLVGDELPKFALVNVFSKGVINELLKVIVFDSFKQRHEGLKISLHFIPLEANTKKAAIAARSAPLSR